MGTTLAPEDIMSTRRRISHESATVVESAICAEEGQDFDPMAVDGSSTQTRSTPQSMPMGIPIPAADYRRLKKDAETTPRPQTRAQEDRHGHESSPRDKEKRG